MKVIIGQNIKVEVEGANHTELFENISAAQEVFGVEECGNCHNKHYRFVVRKVEKMEGKKMKEYKYYELHCPKCKARLAFGQHQEGNTLFPRRKDANDNYLPNGGWTVYKKEDDNK